MVTSRIHISAKIREELRRHLEDRAKQEGRSMSNMLERILEEDKKTNGRIQ